MARSSSRKNRIGIFSRLYSPVGHLFMAGKESVGAVTNTAKGVVGEGLNGLNKIGRSVTGHANMAVNDLIKGKRSRKNRKGGKRNNVSRKNRRSTRRNRRTNRK
jgi:hypothetical protein